MTIRTIKPSGGDYSNLTAWVASLEQTLTAPQQADIYNFGAGGLIEPAGVPLRGFNTTATNKLILNVPPGERHKGVAHSGAYLRNNPGAFGITTLRFGSNVNFVDVRWLEVESLDAAAAAFHWNLSCDASNAFVMDHCIIHCSTMPIGAFAPQGNYIYRNNIFYSTGSSRVIETLGTRSVELTNCTAYTQGGDFVYVCGQEATITNCYGGGASREDFATVQRPSGAFNASSDGTATALFPRSVSNVNGASVFSSVVGGSEDFHLKGGRNPLVNAGTKIASMTDDVVGTPRPRESPWDISAFERIAPAERGDLMQQLNGMEIGLGAALIAPSILATKVERRSVLKGFWLPWT